MPDTLRKELRATNLRDETHRLEQWRDAEQLHQAKKREHKPHRLNVHGHVADLLGSELEPQPPTGESEPEPGRGFENDQYESSDDDLGSDDNLLSGLAPDMPMEGVEDQTVEQLGADLAPGGLHPGPLHPAHNCERVAHVPGVHCFPLPETL